MRLANVCSRLLKYWDSGHDFAEDDIFDFFEGIVDYIEGDRSKTYPKQFLSLSKQVRDTWYFKELDKFGRRQGFLLGSIWGATQVSKIVKQRQSEKIADNDICQKYSKGEYGWLLKAIKNNPGIRHCDLAKKRKLSASNLSQIVTKLQKDELITYSRGGREKYYYLQPRGSMVYKTIQDNAKKESVHYRSSSGIDMDSNLIERRNICFEYYEADVLSDNKASQEGGGEIWSFAQGLENISMSGTNKNGMLQHTYTE